MIAAQEVERRRLAGDIHDGITQRLVSLAFHLDAAADAVVEDTDVAVRELARARELTDLTLDEAHAAIAGLRPPVLDDLGLTDGLASLARSIAQVPVRVVGTECDLPEHVVIALYRIAQEALQNVVKHAGAPPPAWSCAATRGWCACGSPTTAPASTRTPHHPGFGLSGMAERAELVGGHLDVRSGPGRGTTVEVRIPVTPPR